jgi:hypothetical protein
MCELHEDFHPKRMMIRPDVTEIPTAMDHDNRGLVDEATAAEE